MKICPKCGVTQSDKRTSCVDCGTRLEDPVSKEIEAKLQAEGEQKLEKLYNKRAVSYTHLAAAMCRDNSLPILVFNLNHPENIVAAVKGEPVGTLVHD